MPRGDYSGYEASDPASFSHTCATVDGWIPDSDASGNINFNSALVLNAQPYIGSDRVMISNDQFL